MEERVKQRTHCRARSSTEYTTCYMTSSGDSPNTGVYDVAQLEKEFLMLKEEMKYQSVVFDEKATHPSNMHKNRYVHSLEDLVQ